MNLRGAALAAATLSILIVVGSLSCSSGGTGGSYLISDAGGIAASAGQIQSSAGSWSFDAGVVPLFTTEKVVFTVTNSGTAAFTCRFSQSFDPPEDLTIEAPNPFTVGAGSSGSFTTSFTPRGAADAPETGTLTLTPSIGDPITVKLTCTPEDSFAVEYNGMQLTDGEPVEVPSGTDCPFDITNYSGKATITLVKTDSWIRAAAPPPPLVEVTGTGFLVSQQPVSLSFPPGYQSGFVIQNGNSTGGNTAVITMQGISSTTNTYFYFAGNIVDLGPQ